MDAPLSVKRLLEQVKARLEPAFASVSVVGEVSNFRGSGRHWYFTLKEDGASLSCAVWASQQLRLKHVPQDGQRVVVKGSLSVYVPGGSFSLAVTACELEGVGDLAAQLRRLEADLRAAGVFDRPKRPIPSMPRRIGVVAALGGAALRDVLEVTGRRAPGIDVLIAPAAAQGERCVPEVLMALQEVQDAFWGCDLVLVVRGGGSLEDLWSFNDPELVRAVAACRLPIITGVGHEIDTTLVDLAADARAATPSQAAEWATPDRDAMAQRLHRSTDRLGAAMGWQLRLKEATLAQLAEGSAMDALPRHLARLGSRLEAVQHLLRRMPLVSSSEQRLERLRHRLALAHPRGALDRQAARLALLRQRLAHASQVATGEADRPRWVEATRRLVPAVQQRLTGAQHRLEVLQERLKALDPTGPLARGFVLVRDGTGLPVTSAQSLPPQAPIRIQWQDGERMGRLD